MNNKTRSIKYLATSLLVFSCLSSLAATISVTDKSGQPMKNVMVMQTPVVGFNLDTSDMGYPPERKLNRSNTVYTLFTNSKGLAVFNTYSSDKVRIRTRFPDYRDVTIELMGNENKTIAIEPLTDPLKRAESRPANTWLAELNLSDDVKLKKHYIMQCGFCHQQGSHFFRRPRPEQNWEDVIYRMVSYGARVHDEAQEQLPKILASEYKRLYEHPEIIPTATPWNDYLQTSLTTEWPIGDAFSQMHDLLYHSSGMVYVGDNLQDRMYEINPETGEYIIYKLKREDDDEHGGLLGSRLTSYPKHDTYAGIHSFAESPKDGHIFITASYQQRLIEFDPVKKQFINHEMEDGYYPHTIRVDKNDRVWFTMALSNQIAMFDRTTKEFTMFDLPSRSTKESMTISTMGTILKMMNLGIPMANWFSVDEQSTGLPLPYGIDITPNGDVWFARLHADSIGKIDGKSLEIFSIDTPFIGPRRLRSDAQGNLWIAAFPESMIVKYDPSENTFTNYPIPVHPVGSETPYSLNVDLTRNMVWINGNTSDALYSFNISTETWAHYPLPKRVTFTRDVEFAPNGDVYTTNSSFPSWHIENAQPTLIRLQPNYVKLDEPVEAEKK